MRPARRSSILTLSLVALGMAQMGSPACADPLPESLRIQQEVEKKDQQNPVVPIDRPNAHHRTIEAPNDATGPRGDGLSQTTPSSVSDSKAAPTPSPPETTQQIRQASTAIGPTGAAVDR